MRRSMSTPRRDELAETAAAWYDGGYLPAVAAIHEIWLEKRYTYKTDADLFLWVEGRRRSLEPMMSSVSWLEAAQVAAGEWHGPLTRRRLMSQKRTPLRQRTERNPD
jgi:hypothetical protein